MYATESEHYFPFEVDNHKFDWETFKSVHENMNCKELLEIIS